MCSFVFVFLVDVGDDEVEAARRFRDGDSFAFVLRLYVSFSGARRLPLGLRDAFVSTSPSAARDVFSFEPAVATSSSICFEGSVEADN